MKWIAVALCILPFVLVGCAPGAPSGVALPTRTAAPAATATSGQAAEPSPVTTLLDTVPADCPVTPPPQSLSFSHFGSFPGAVTFVGKAPVWIAQPYYPTVVHVNQAGYTPWPGTKIIWEVGPNAAPVTTIQVINRATGEAAWWGPGGEPNRAGQSGTGVALSLTLDATTPSPADPHGIPQAGWQEWGSFVYLPQAGCYTLRVSWPGGQWQSSFAAGQ